MKPEQEGLLKQARNSLDAAKILHDSGYYGFAASRAYYSMFYTVQAFLLEKNLSFSKHSGVIAAFGEHFVKTGMAPKEFHRYLIQGMELRHAGDYGGGNVSLEESTKQISRAKSFLELAERTFGR